MAQSVTLLITSHDCWLLPWPLKRPNDCQRFAHTPTGLQQLKDSLLRLQQIRLDILLDLPEESYQIESLPPVTGATLRQLLQRKYAQIVAEAPYGLLVALNSLAHETPRYLFCWVNPTPLMHAWLATLPCEGVQVRMLACLSFRLSSLVTALMPDHRQVLLVVCQATEVRLHFFVAGQLWFSRAVLLDLDRHRQASSLTSRYQADLQRLTNEIAQTHHYLQSKQWITSGEALALLLVGAEVVQPLGQACTPPEQPNALAQALQAVGLSHMPSRMITAQACLAQLDEQLHAPQMDEMTQALICAAMQTKQMPHFAAPMLTFDHQLARAQQLFRVSLGALFLCCIAFVGLLAHVWWPPSAMQLLTPASEVAPIHQRASNGNALQAATPDMARLAKQLARASHAHQQVHDLQQVIAVDQALLAAQHSPASLLDLLAGLPITADTWQLEQLHWSFGPANPPAQAAATGKKAAKETHPPPMPSRAVGPWMIVARLQFGLLATADKALAHQAWHQLLAHVALQPQVIAMQVNPTGASSEVIDLHGETQRINQPPTHPELLLWMQPRYAR